MVAGGQVCGMTQVGGTEWVQVAGMWNGCGWQAQGIDAGGWVAAYRAGVSVHNKRGSEGVVGRVWVQAR
jgi:hypothetical protein